MRNFQSFDGPGEPFPLCHRCFPLEDSRTGAGADVVCCSPPLGDGGSYLMANGVGDITDDAWWHAEQVAQRNRHAIEVADLWTSLRERGTRRLANSRGLVRFVVEMSGLGEYWRQRDDRLIDRLGRRHLWEIEQLHMRSSKHRPELLKFHTPPSHQTATTSPPAYQRTRPTSNTRTQQTSERPGRMTGGFEPTPRELKEAQERAKARQSKNPPPKSLNRQLNDLREQVKSLAESIRTLQPQGNAAQSITQGSGRSGSPTPSHQSHREITTPGRRQTWQL